MSDSQEYALRWRGRQSGPYPAAEINRMLDDHEIGMEHEILYQDEWITLEAFFSAVEQAAAAARQRQQPVVPTVVLAPVAPPPRENLHIKLSVTPTAEAARGPAQPGAREERPRSRLLFAVLAVVAGFSGAHNFYAREWLTGLLQLLLSVATSLMGFGIVASWLWAMVEAAVVRKDGRGVEMV